MTIAPDFFVSQPPSHLSIKQAAVRSVAYADVFEYPLRADEVHRYLHGTSATLEETLEVLASCGTPGSPLTCTDGYYTLRGKEGLVDIRRRRAAHATQLWPVAVKYGRLIADLPFVRMVAVTGSLAWDNVERGADIDYLIVTEPDRLWVCRWLLAALGRVARRDGVFLCPNYMVSERALVLAERNLYSAYELAQMVPITGLDIHDRLVRANPWARAYLPNAVEPARPPVSQVLEARPWHTRAFANMARLGEKSLRSPLGMVLDRVEMKYRIHKRAKESIEQGETSYGKDWYKAHISGHRHRVLAAFDDRLRDLG